MAIPEEQEEEEIQLSSSTLSALKDFYREQEAQQKQFDLLKAKADAAALELDQNGDDDEEPLTMAAFMEDWNASQFWYTQDTADTLAREMLRGATSADAIAFVSAPSAFLAARNMLSKIDRADRPGITLLEYDERFAIFREFVRYDFNKPFDLPASLQKSFTRIMSDPPFLNDECQTKTALTVNWLAVNSSASSSSTSNSGYTTPADNLWLAIATGERVGSIVQKLYGRKGVKGTDYEVQHQKGLSNEFHLYANFANESWNLQISAEGD